MMAMKRVGGHHRAGERIVLDVVARRSESRTRRWPNFGVADNLIERAGRRRLRQSRRKNALPSSQQWGRFLTSLGRER